MSWKPDGPARPDRTHRRRDRRQLRDRLAHRPGARRATAPRWCWPAATSSPGGEARRDDRRHHPGGASSTSPRWRRCAAFAERWEGPLDLLVNNAGVMTPAALPRDRGRLRAAVRHQPPRPRRAHRAAAAPRCSRRPAPRVVTVSSIAHHARRRLACSRATRRRRTGPNARLRQQQAGQPALRPRAPARAAAAAGSPLTSTAAHPGVSATNLVASRDGMGADRADPLDRAVRLPDALPVRAAPARNPTLYAATEAEPGCYTGPQRLRRDPRPGRAREAPRLGPGRRPGRAALGPEPRAADRGLVRPLTARARSQVSHHRDSSAPSARSASGAP